MKSPKKSTPKHVSFEIGETNLLNGTEVTETSEFLARCAGPMTTFESNFEIERPGSSDSTDSVDSEDEARKLSFKFYV